MSRTFAEIYRLRAAGPEGSVAREALGAQFMTANSGCEGGPHICLTDATTIGKAVVTATSTTALSATNGTARSSDTYYGIASLSAPCQVTLPAVSSFPRGKPLYVADESGACSSTLTITVFAAGSDTIAGQGSVTITAAYQKLVFHSNGSHLWTVS